MAASYFYCFSSSTHSFQFGNSYCDEERLRGLNHISHSMVLKYPMTLKGVVHILVLHFSKVKGLSRYLNIYLFLVDYFVSISISFYSILI